MTHREKSACQNRSVEAAIDKIYHRLPHSSSLTYFKSHARVSSKRTVKFELIVGQFSLVHLKLK